MNRIRLRMTPALRKLLSLTFPDYRGRQYVLVAVDKVTLTDRDWSGGTHADYRVLRDVGNGLEVADYPAFRPSEGAAEYAPTIPLPAGYVVIAHRWFCGRDRGISIYAPAATARALEVAPSGLPALA